MEHRAVDGRPTPREIGARIRRVVAPLLALAALAMLAIRLLGEPVVGVADNGDGWRVMAPAGLAHRAPLGDPDTRVVERALVRRQTRFWSHPSSGAALACVARAWPFAAEGRFDLRQLVVAHLAVLVLALAAAFARRTRGPLVAAVPLALASPFYGDFLASFYPDAAALLGVALAAFAFAPDDGSKPRGVPIRATTLVVGSALLGFSSRSHAWLPALVALVFVASERTHRSGRRGTGLALLAIAVLAPLHFERGSGYRFAAINQYHSVFRGIAQLADDPEAVLRDLDLPANSREHIGRSYFVDPPEPALARALEGATPRRVLRAYVVRPHAVVRAFGRAATALDGGIPIWSNHGARRGDRFVEPALSVHALRTRWLPRSAVFVAALLALAFLGASTRREWLPLGAFLAGTCGVEVLGALLGDGTFSLPRHLLVAGYALDVLIVLTLGLVVGEWVDILLDRRPSAAPPDALA